MYLAVDIFMVLSGFVLARSSNADFLAPFEVPQVGRFLLRRLARIYPVYLLSSVVCALLVLTGLGVWGDPKLSALMILTNLAMIQSWGGPYDGLNAVSWSISTEWAANLLFPLFGFLFMRVSIRASVFAALATLLGLLLFAALSAGGAPDDPPAFGALTWYSFPGAMVRCITEFMLGMFCWRLRRDVQRTAWLGGDTVLIPTVVAMAVMTLFQSTDMAFLLLAGILVIGFSHERSRVAAALASSVPRVLGMVSFSLYLWHIPMLQLAPWLTVQMTRHDVWQPWLVAHVALMLMVIGVSAVSFTAIEKPAQQWLQRLFAAWLRRGGCRPIMETGRVSPSQPAANHLG
jgi:peptidoglycan/LPS O-acetylase OafA/YrhL